MTDELTICDACEGDAAAIADIYAHYVLESAASFETEPPDAQVMADRIAKVLGSGYPWLVVRDSGDRVLGFAYAQRFGPRAGYLYSCETHIFVRNDALGRGIGTMLINALLAACEARGYRQAFALIAGTEPASVVLHARAGYLPCGTLTGAGWKHGQWTDVFMMQRKLGAGNETLPESHA
ncbi:phosphinothricin acetyltransferase [Novosphingobium chloroacetimidivorans]|uniref:Phosphinothricin acetyltransferase n=1 Tax=Novosphingobium chloroacetimidivorans TaxID=1428314 RepID=A0A7W7NUJ3_9SPHN|nr:GNAT family N-acetyltransferase [Novosphingobium chloroacetimidivorans]MBB4857271.1 phosphinothricin acetyltransferase [Novosphingobium chloroacetimidivorans]